jgi:hypothetical protein
MPLKAFAKAQRKHAEKAVFSLNFHVDSSVVLLV